MAELDTSVLVTSILGTFEVAVDRLVARLEGLGDDEYLWEPVDGAWSIRPGASGDWVLDGKGGEADAAAHVTTIAWRLTHLSCLVLGGFATWLRDGGSPDGGADEVPPTADAALAILDRNWRRWKEGVERCDDERWLAPIGPDFGPFADANAIDLALHVLDEVVHHAAEVGLLRDLYAARPLRST